MNKLIFAAMIVSSPALAAPAAVSKAVLCNGETKRKVIGLPDDVRPFREIFIIDDAAKTWRRYSEATAGSEPICQAPLCVLNYGTSKIVAREGNLVNALDRAQGTFTSANLENGSDPIVTITKATCQPTRIPSASSAKSKF